MKKSIFCFLFFVTAFVVGLATPREVVIVRHADKWKSTHTGPNIDPTGYSRAVNLAFYFLGKFGKPDYIFVPAPVNNSPFSYERSMRPIQTVSPLANILSKEAHDPGGYDLSYPFKSTAYMKLAQLLLTSPNYKNALILICCDHYNVPALAKALGVNQKLPVWPARDFDTVYVLKFSRDGKLASFQLLNNQYPTKPIKSWKEVQKKLNS